VALKKTFKYLKHDINGRLIMRQSLFSFIMALTIGLILSLPVDAADYSCGAEGDAYYLSSTTGDDSNSGTAPSSPWRTMDKLGTIRWTIEKGADICFMRGDTFSGKLDILRGGLPDDPMIIGAYGSGPKPILSNPGDPESIILTAYPSYGIDLENIVITGLELSDVKGQGISIYSSLAEDITISDVEIHEVEIGNGILFVNVDGYLIEDCEIYDIGNSGIALLGSEEHPVSNGIIRNCVLHDTVTNDPITLHRDGDDFPIGSNHLIENVTSYNSAEDGFDITSGSDIIIRDCEAHSNGLASVSIAWSAKNVLIENCHFHDDRMGIVIGTPSENITVMNTIIEDMGRHDITIGCSSESGCPGTEAKDIKIYNNVIVHPEADDHAVDIYVRTNGVEFKNNIVYAPSTSPVRYVDMDYQSAGCDFQKNIWWGFAYGGGDGGINQDPMFVDFQGGDYHILSGSPAIDQGLDIGRAADRDGVAVPQGSAPDIGVFEYLSSGSCQGTDISCGAAPPCTNCDLLDGCNSSSYLDFSCQSGDCVETADDCSDCSCHCGGFDQSESLDAENCDDGLDNDCDGLLDLDDPGCQEDECITESELMASISSWKQGLIEIEELVMSISEWKSGCSLD
jgi:hypothetical protein